MNAAGDERVSDRADAKRSRARLTEAVTEVFTERGLATTISDIAERASLGAATVYRNFPSKSVLIERVANQWLTSWRDALAEELEQDSLSFDELMRALVERLRTDRLALDLLRSHPPIPEAQAARAEVEDLFTRLIRRAAERGEVAEGTTYDDVAVLVLGVCGRLAEREITDAVVWRKYAALLMQAFKHPH